MRAASARAANWSVDSCRSRRGRLLPDPGRGGAVPPLGQRAALVQRQPYTARGSDPQTRPERLRQHPSVVQRVVRPLLYDPEVRGQRLQLVVRQRQPQLLRQRDRAQPLSHRRFGLRARVLPGDHRPVEHRVVRDEHTVREPRRELLRDLLEERRSFEHVTRQPVDPHRPRVPLRIHQRVPVVLDLAPRVESVHSRRNYPVVPGQPGRLHVDDRVPLWIRGKPRRLRRCGRVVFEHGP